MSHNHGSPPRRQRSWDDWELEPADDELIDLDADTVGSDDMGRAGLWERRLLRGRRRKAARRAALRHYIEEGMPPDADEGFDLDTFTGRAGWQISASLWWKGLTAVVMLAVVAGWFTLLHIRPPVLVWALVVAGLVLVPIVVLWMLGRVAGRKPEA